MLWVGRGGAGREVCGLGEGCRKCEGAGGARRKWRCWRDVTCVGGWHVWGACGQRGAVCSVGAGVGVGGGVLGVGRCSVI